MFKKNQIIIGVSGGPDSMFLLDKFKKKNIIVAHVNYHYRSEESNLDQKLVEDYCVQNKIKYYVLDVNDDFNKRYDKIKNKQHKAREIRYDFFFQLASKYQSEQIFIAHNKDDFIETALIQKNRDKNNLKLFFGLEDRTTRFITKENRYIIISRPILKYWKSDILRSLNKSSIPYRIDQSNYDLKYDRNKIRSILSSQYTQKQKSELYKSFISINKFNSEKKKEIETKYLIWYQKKFETNFLINDCKGIEISLLYLFINNYSSGTNLSFGILNNIKEFSSKKDMKNKYYKLNESLYLTKSNHQLKILNKEEIDENWK